MKKLVGFIALFLTTHTFANELHHFAEIKSAAIIGTPLHIAVDFTQCTTTKKSSSLLENTGVYSPSAIAILADHITTSSNHFTLGNKRFPEKPVYEFMKFNINQDDTVYLTYQILDAASYSPLSEKTVFTCKLDMGAKIYI